MKVPIEERKENGNSKLSAKNMGADKQAELIRGLADGWTYDMALEWLSVECGISVSLSALTPFHKRHVLPLLQDRKRFALMGAEAVEEFAKKQGVFDAATILDFKEKAARMLRDPNADSEETRKWMETYIKAMAAMREDEKLAMLKKKAEQADAAKDVIKQKLNPEEENRRLREILK